jgi:hypothetical protein
MRSSIGLIASVLICCATFGTAHGYDKRKFCLAEASNVVMFLDVTTPYDDRDREALSDR